MSRPIPVEVVPSHVHLSATHHGVLFGEGHMGTIRGALSQTGQFAYEETVTLLGENNATLTLRVLGPSRRTSQVEITPTEAAFLGLTPAVAVSGMLDHAPSSTVKTPRGSIHAAVIIPVPHLHLSDTEARDLRLQQGAIVRVDVVGDTPRMLEHVVVRVHPTYRARLHIHSDLARDLWLHTGAHVRVRDIQT